MFERINRLLDSFEDMKVPAYDLLVYHKGKEVYRRLYGYADYEKTVPVKGNERYNIYSCSKPITCTGALLLWEKGAFDLSEPVEKYLPEFGKVRVRGKDGLRPPCHPMLIRHLFTMTAGLTYDLHTENCRRAKELTNGCCPTREFIRYLADDPLSFDPGEHYCYSLCHDVLAALVEVISGERFGEYIRKHIFEPCGMEHSSFMTTPEEDEQLMAQYSYHAESGEYEPVGKALITFKTGSDYESGGAGCVTTVEDYVRFLEGLRTGGLLRPETLKAMTKNQLSPALLKEFPLSEQGYGYGLGVRCGLDGSGQTDFGWGGAAAAFAACDPVCEYSLYYAQHVLNSPNQGTRILLPAALREDLGYGTTAIGADENRWY